MSSFMGITLTIAGDAVTVPRRHTYTRGVSIDGTPLTTGEESKLSISNYNDSLRSLAPYVIVLSPASGVSDNLNTINGLQEGDICVVMTATNFTISLIHGTGNLYLADGDDFGTVPIEGRTQSVTLYHNGFELVELHRSFPPVL